MKDDLCPAFIAIIEVLVGSRCFAKWQFMRDDERGICLTVMDQIAQAAVVSLYVRLPGAHLLPLEPELAKVKRDLPLFLESVFSLWILGDKYANDADVPGRFHSVDQRVHHHIRYFFALGVMTLVADAFGAAVAPQPSGWAP